MNSKFMKSFSRMKRFELGNALVIAYNNNYISCFILSDFWVTLKVFTPCSRVLHEISGTWYYDQPLDGSQHEMAYDGYAQLRLFAQWMLELKMVLTWYSLLRHLIYLA